MTLKKIEFSDRDTTLAKLLANLQEETEDLSRQLLANLSDLNPSELKQFEATWEGLNTKRKCATLSRLCELAEDSIEYDFGAIFRHALRDTDSTVRQSAIEGLWENEEPSLIRPLLNILAEDSSEITRESAATALGRFAVLAECHRIDADNVVRLSQPLLTIVNNQGESLPLRRRALEAVAPLSLADVTQAIWAAYRREEPEMRVGALRAMGLNRDLLWLPTIIQELASDDPEIRYVSAEAAGALGEEEAVTPLIELLDDSDPEVRLATIQALGNIGGATAKRALEYLVKHEDSSIREAATNALSEMELYTKPLSIQETG